MKIVSKLLPSYLDLVVENEPVNDKMNASIRFQRCLYAFFCTENFNLVKKNDVI